jgi:hypothetical protein
MRTISFGGLAIVAAAALAAPLALGLFPRIRLPAIVLEIVLGIVIGPQVLGWVSIDTPIQVMSLLGLAFLRDDPFVRGPAGHCLRGWSVFSAGTSTSLALHADHTQVASIRVARSSCDRSTRKGNA